MPPSLNPGACARLAALVVAYLHLPLPEVQSYASATNEPSTPGIKLTVSGTAGTARLEAWAVVPLLFIPTAFTVLAPYDKWPNKNSGQQHR
mmetsp:Transcript_52800/g.104908  ORF Transcript_52800/g.104908 Transcript_52800/m.104908 type:complete len:91 (-) Transcript_52800:50-322(-)